MKAKDLIAALQEFDPEIEVVVSTEEIFDGYECDIVARNNRIKSINKTTRYPKDWFWMNNEQVIAISI